MYEWHSSQPCSPPDNLHPLELDHWRSAFTRVWSETQTQRFGHLAKTFRPTITAPFYRNDICVFVLQYDWTSWDEIILLETDTVFWLLNSLCKLFSLAWSQWASAEKLKFWCFLFFSGEYPIGFFAQHRPFIIRPLPVFYKLQLFPMCPTERREVWNFIVWLHFWSFTEVLKEWTWKYQDVRPETRIHSWVKMLHASFFGPASCMPEYVRHFLCLHPIFSGHIGQFEPNLALQNFGNTLFKHLWK